MLNMNFSNFDFTKKNSAMPSSKDHQLIKTVNALLTKDIPFVVYRFPNETNSCLVVQLEKIHLVLDIKDLCQRAGFIIAPFESVISETAYFIRPDRFACDENGYEDILKAVEDLPPKQETKDYAENHIMTHQEYLEIANYLIDKIKNGEMDKVVLSRVIKEKLPNHFDAGKFYERLCEQYPDAFVYLFRLPDSGVWVGATPETLIKQDERGEVEIVSLAGTRVRKDPGDEVHWEEKELREQEYVSEYIRLKISGLGIHDYEESPVETVQAGHLAHLRTVFKLPAEKMVDKVGELVKRLHPTPAVCGLSKVDAFRSIEKAEIHDRKYYTGFLGPWGLQGKRRLFVNLRCAEIANDSIFLYVGGGLTGDSVAEREWEETEQKALTLLSVLP